MAAVACSLEQIELYITARYIIISIGYRFVPETKLKWVLEDVQDAYYWVKSFGPDQFGVDPDRLTVICHSAGGYLAPINLLEGAPAGLKHSKFVETFNAVQAFLRGLMGDSHIL